MLETAEAGSAPNSQSQNAGGIRLPAGSERNLALFSTASSTFRRSGSAIRAPASDTSALRPFVVIDNLKERSLEDLCDGIVEGFTGTVLCTNESGAVDEIQDPEGRGGELGGSSSPVNFCCSVRIADRAARRSSGVLNPAR